MAMLPRAIYMFSAIPTKIFHTAGINNPRICMEPEKTLSSQKNVEKDNQNWWHHNSGLQALLQTCKHQNSMVRAQKHIDQWNRIENPGMYSQLYSQLIFNKAGKNIHWKKDSFFNKRCWENWTATCRRMKLDPSFTPYTKITIKILEESTDNNFLTSAAASC